MPTYKISQLTTATAVSATNQFEINQNGTSKSVEVSVIDAYIKSTSNLPVVVSVSSAADAVRITQTGTGNAFVVEDSANPDATPFVVDASGNVGIGTTTPDSTRALTLNRPDNYGGIELRANNSIMARIQQESTGNLFIDSGIAVTSGSTIFRTANNIERMRITNAGSVGIGVTPGVQNTLQVSRAIGGSAFSAGIVSSGQVQTTATSRADYFISAHATAGSVPLVIGYQAQQGTITGTLTDQIGFRADASLTGATNNYGFYSNIASGTGRWNFYANGTADNYFAGNVGIGTTTPGASLNVVANTASDAVRITQTGAGNALVVEDSANPDSTPFAVDANGTVIIGGTARFTTGTTAGSLLQTITGSATISRFANDANPQRLEFVKSRSTTAGSAATIVQSGDTLGQVNWQGADGTSFVLAAAIEAAVDGTPGTNDMPGRLVFSTTADGASSPTERMRINSSGNVGIGTSSPSAKLDVVSDRAVISYSQKWSVYNGASFENSVVLGFDGTSTYFGNFQNYAFRFITNSIERMRIDANGNIIAGASAALATNATNGFLYVPTCAGTPTGTPTAITGMAPIVVNTTNNKLYFYSGGAWRDAGP